MRPGKKSLQRSKFMLNIPSCWECGDWKSNFHLCGLKWRVKKKSPQNTTISGSVFTFAWERTAREQRASCWNITRPDRGLRRNINYAKISSTPCFKRWYAPCSQMVKEKGMPGEKGGGVVWGLGSAEQMIVRCYSLLNCFIKTR